MQPTEVLLLVTEAEGNAGGDAIEGAMAMMISSVAWLRLVSLMMWLTTCLAMAVMMCWLAITR